MWAPSAMKVEESAKKRTKERKEAEERGIWGGETMGMGKEMEMGKMNQSNAVNTDTRTHNRAETPRTVESAPRIGLWTCWFVDSHELARTRHEVCRSRRVEGR